ncbi:hypothetical protein G6F60_015432 [Rhizopus arrhizus]|nr:hypothetical protein G6F60_015432 [Rhizopus arrhizus]
MVIVQRRELLEPVTLMHWLSMRVRRRSAKVITVSPSASRKIATNSSPPIRPVKSPRRTVERSSSATWHMTSSPAWWP